jgi:hypothetical protein
MMNGEERLSYLTIGKNFAHGTTPFENRPENEKMREVVDMVCAVVTPWIENISRLMPEQSRVQHVNPIACSGNLHNACK